MQTWLIVCASGNNVSKEVSDRHHILISGNGLSLPINITCVRRNALCHLGALWCNEDDIIFFYVVFAPNGYFIVLNVPRRTGYFDAEIMNTDFFSLFYNRYHTDNVVVLSSPWTGMEDTWAGAIAKHRGSFLIKDRESTQSQLDPALWLFF